MLVINDKLYAPERQVFNLNSHTNMSTSKPNFDADELKKFAKLANHWWDEHGELWTLHYVNPLRFAFITEHCQLKGAKVLDVGCGGGILAESLAKAGADVTAIDMDPTVIMVAKQHQKIANLQIDYQCVPVEELSTLKPGYFDIITCMEMLEHVPDPKSILVACSHLLKPNGHFFASTLNRNLKSYLGAIIAAEYVLRMLPRNTHDYRKFIKPAELCDWLRQVGLKPELLKGISYKPFSKQFYLSDNIDINYLLYAKK